MRRLGVVCRRMRLAAAASSVLRKRMPSASASASTLAACSPLRVAPQRRSYYHLGHRPDVVPVATPGNPLVREVRAYVIPKADEEAGGSADCHSQAKGHWILDTPIATPMSGYPAYKQSRTSFGINAIGTMIVEVELTNGVTGVGVTTAGEPGCYIVEKHLSRFVEGQDPRNVELVYDQMWRASLYYGRKGLPIQALSAIDLALWDALGKLRQQPVWSLLGGKTKGRLPIYATSSRPDLSQKLGFAGGKFPLPYGPCDGEEGLNKNIARIAEARASVGPDFPLMVDCWMALTVPYAVELMRRAAPYRVKWFEEMLPPDDYAGYTEVRQRTSGAGSGYGGSLVTTGEHEYTRYGFLKLLQGKCADILQPDITWCGGITEGRRIVALGSAFDVPVVPHGSSVYSFHLQYAFPSCPFAECIMMSPKADTIVPTFGNLFVDEPLPRDGYIDLDDSKTGFGITLNPKLNLFRPYDRSLTPAQLKVREELYAAQRHEQLIAKANAK